MARKVKRSVNPYGTPDQQDRNQAYDERAAKRRAGRDPAKKKVGKAVYREYFPHQYWRNT